MSEWFEDESFWKVMFLFLFLPERIDGAGEEVDLISALAKFGEGEQGVAGQGVPTNHG